VSIKAYNWLIVSICQFLTVPFSRVIHYATFWKIVPNLKRKKYLAPLTIVAAILCLSLDNCGSHFVPIPWQMWLPFCAYPLTIVAAILCLSLDKCGGHFVPIPWQLWQPFCAYPLTNVAAILCLSLDNCGSHFVPIPWQMWRPFCAYPLTKLAAILGVIISTKYHYYRWFR
jgi:hypothetical protein